MNSPVLNPNQLYTYADYFAWNDDKRYELYNGIVWCMSPAPSIWHQSVLGNVYGDIKYHLKGKKCKVFFAPIDVKLADNVVLQPDIIVVCDLQKLNDKRFCNGAPDLVVEALSPATQKKDLHEKYELYEKYGVREYWIVHPLDETLMVFKLVGTKFVLDGLYSYEDKVKVGIFEDLEIDLRHVFEHEEDEHKIKLNIV